MYHYVLRDENGRRTKRQITFKLRPELLEKLRAHSEQTGLTMTKIVERLLEQRFAA